MKKKVISFITVLLLISSVVFVAIGCGRQKTINGVYKYETAEYSMVWYFYDEGKGYVVFFDEGKVESEGEYFEYRILDDKYIAMTSDYDGTMIATYDFENNKKILILEIDGAQIALKKQ